MLAYLLISVIVLLLLRLFYLLTIQHPRFRTLCKKTDKKSFKGGKVKVVIVLGSGGHTTEMLAVISNLDPKKYYKYYVIASSDSRSYDKVAECESKLRDSEYELHYIPRSREVAQKWISTVFTTFVSFLLCVPKMTLIRPDLVLCNGPGTCIPIAIAAWLLRVFYFRAHPTIIFIESLCRVKTLSLSGKILRYFADELLVQWPELSTKYPDTKFIGRL